ncbi:MAG: cation diffusion facilitator family transporter [Synechococcales bacterium]|nr:cation diffusion facilitator family transporter [Synechococcales bacterium]
MSYNIYIPDNNIFMHHHHHPVQFYPDRLFKIGIALNFSFVLLQFGFGWWSNSLALLADAGHNLGDVFGLLIAWGGSWLARRRPTPSHTYGFRRASILSPLLNSALLLGFTLFIGLEAIQRLLEPRPIASLTVIGVASVGILINTGTALLFFTKQHQDLNLKGAFLHMLADAIVSLGVVVSGFLILWTGWQWLDSVTSLILAVVIAIGAWQLLQEALKLVLDGVPPQVNLSAIQAYLLDLKGVTSIHDLHIWAMSSTEPALTVHLIMPAGVPHPDFLSRIAQDLHQQFNIEHSTIQIETGRSFLPCSQSNCGV